MPSPFDLTGRVAVVTGGNGGIGLGMAKGMAAAGAAVVVAGRNEKKNEAALAELRAVAPGAEALRIDVTKAEDCARLVETTLQRFGRLDILVNNAGTNIRKQPQEYSPEEWHLVMDTNLTSAFLLCRAAHAALKARGGKVINIGSMMSIFGASFSAAYASSKGGIVQYTKVLAVAWAPDKIQVNAVLPGWIDTELTRAGRKQIAGLHERVLARTPAARWGVPEDLAGIGVFLASSASDFVTGTAIPVDGGYAVQA